MSEELDRDEFGSKITELAQGLERDLAPIFIEMVNSVKRWAAPLSIARAVMVYISPSLNVLLS